MTKLDPARISIKVNPQMGVAPGSQTAIYTRYDIYIDNVWACSTYGPMSVLAAGMFAAAGVGEIDVPDVSNIYKYVKED